MLLHEYFSEKGRELKNKGSMLIKCGNILRTEGLEGDNWPDLHSLEFDLYCPEYEALGYLREYAEMHKLRA